MKGKVAPTKSTTKAYISFCFSFSADSAIVSPALYCFLYRQWNKQNCSTPFPKCFYFFSEKNSFSKTFLVECVLSRSGATSCNKRREFWHETHTPLWLQVLIERIIFLTRVKTIVRSSDWLELICVQNFRQSFLVSISQYVYGVYGKRCSCATMELWMHSLA